MGGYVPAMVAPHIGAAKDVAFEQCRQWISHRFAVRAVLIADPLAAGVAAPDVSILCAILQKGILCRSRWRSNDNVIDVFAGDEDALRRAIENVNDIAAVFAVAGHHWGDKDSALRLRLAAQNAMSREMPKPSPSTVFRYKTQPFDLLRAFNAVRKRDTAAAALVVSALVRVVIDGFFSLNRMRPVSTTDVLRVMSLRSLSGSKALRQVLEADIEELCANPTPLERMVVAIIGEEQIIDCGDSHSTENSPSVAPLSASLSRKNQGPAMRAVRSYRKHQDAEAPNDSRK